MKSTSILIIFIFFIGLCVVLAQQIPNTQCPPTLLELGVLIDSAKNNADTQKAQQMIAQVKQCLQSHTEQDSVIAELYHQMGVFQYVNRENIKESLYYFEKSLTLRKRIFSPEHYDLGRNFYMIASCKDKQGDYIAALTNAQIAYNIAQKFDEKPRLLALSSAMLGRLYMNCGDKENGKIYLLKASDLWKEQNKPSELAILENDLSILYDKQKNYELAIQHAKIAIAINDSLLKIVPTDKKLYDRLGDNYINQSTNFQHYENSNKALDLALAALKTYKQNSVENDEHAKRLGCAYIQIGNCYAQKNAWAIAFKQYSTALSIFEKAKLQNNPYYAEAFLSMGKMVSGQNDDKAALMYYQKALKVLRPDFEDTDFLQNPRTDTLAFAPIELIDILSAKATSLYKLARKNPKTPQYIEATERTLRAIDQLVGSMRLSFASDAAKFDLADKMRPIYDIGMSLAKTNNNTADFLMWMEKNKALSMQEALKRQQAKSYAGLPAQVLQEEQQLKADLTRWAKAAQQDTTSASKDSYFKAQEAIVQFEKTLEKDYKRYYDLKYDTKKKVDIATIQAQLPDTMAFIEYALGDDSLFTFVASRTNTQMFSKPLPKGFADSLMALIALQNNDSGNSTSKMAYLREKSSYFYDILLKEPLAAIQGGKPIKRIKIVPDGRLHYLPFDYLLEKPVAESDKLNLAQYPFLMKLYAFSYDYSAALSFDSLYQKSATDATYDFAGFGLKYERVKDYLDVKGKPIEVLKRSFQEVEKVRKRFPPSKIWTDSLKNVSATQFLAQVDKSKVSHFSGHGDLNEEECSLIFSDTSDYILRGSDIYAHEFKQTDLMVLSACNTGNGKLHRGEGVMSFARALSYAGIPATVMTFWSVSESQTSDIIDGFYEHLAAGDTKDIALQKAKMDYLRKGGEPSPYYWSGIALMGNTDALTFKKPTDYRIWLLGCGALLGLLFVAFRQKKFRLAS